MATRATSKSRKFYNKQLNNKSCICRTLVGIFLWAVPYATLFGRGENKHKMINFSSQIKLGCDAQGVNSSGIHLHLSSLKKREFV